MRRDGFDDAIRLGQENRRVIDLAANWCSHIRFERSPLLGVGMLEMETGLPISGPELHCQFERAASVICADTKVVALDFYDRNCVDCPHRVPIAFPNLSSLVLERDEALRASRDAEENAVRARQERRNRRTGRRSPGTPLRNSLLDDIDALEDGQDAEALERLRYAAKTQSSRFDGEVVDSLLEVGTADSLYLVATVRPPDPDLVRRLVRQQPSNPEQLKYLVDHFDLIPDEDVLWAISHFAFLTLDRYPVFQSRTPHPECLRKAYFRLPDAVGERIGDLIASEIEGERDAGVSALIDTIVHSPQDFSCGVEELVALCVGLGVNAPSELYLDRSLLQTLVEAWPDAATDECEKIYGTSERPAREFITSVLTLCLREGGEEETKFSDEAATRVYALLMEWSLADDAGAEDIHLTEFLRTYAVRSPRELLRHFDQVLGTLILYPGRLEATRNRTLLVPNQVEATSGPPNALRHLALRQRMAEILRLVREGINVLPEQAGASVLSLLESDAALSLDEDMRGRLVGALGGAASVRTLYKRVFPMLLTCMLGTSTLLRAKAIGTYGEVCKVDPDAVPESVHESFALATRDPHLIVISACLEVVSEGKAPIRDEKSLRGTLLNWAWALAQSRDNDELLVDILKELRWMYRDDRQDFDGFAIKALSGTSPKEAWRYFHSPEVVQIDEEYTALWFRLSMNDVHRSDYEILSVLRALTPDVVWKHRADIVRLHQLNRNEDLAHEMLTLLLEEGHLTLVETIVGETLATVPASAAFVPRRLYLETLREYCRLELALQSDDLEAAGSASSKVKSLEEVRKKDAEQNDERRGLGFRRPN